VSRTDTQLEADVRTALQQDSATRKYAIGVMAKNGTVVLSGKEAPRGRCSLRPDAHPQSCGRANEERQRA
jgi:hypothetical protein